jgi:hypothetical protein
MSFSRRKFLRSGTLVALCAGLPLKNVFAETLERSGPTTGKILAGHNHLDTILHLNRAAFARCLNTKFSLHYGEAKGELKLLEVNDLTPESLRRSAEATGRECFSAVFLGSPSAPLPQATYAVTHEKLGTFSLLVVPNGEGKKGCYYEALFNRLH